MYGDMHENKRLVATATNGSTHHESACRNEIRLGQAQGAPPMNGQDANHPEIPQQDRDGYVIYGLVQLDKDLPARRI
jgi:hypothetical protein